MCLLIVLHRAHPDAELVVAANRDELLARPATAMTVLQERGPRILGGRDEVAGGTWMAVNELGLFAALTNRPSTGRDPQRRSRGEWPLFLARFESPREAAAEFVDRFAPEDFNPGWVLVGNGGELLYLDMTQGPRGLVRELEPGIHVLENRPLGAPSRKVDLVRDRLEGVDRLRGAEAIARLERVLADHRAPVHRPADAAADPGEEGFERPAAAEAACVHLGAYGTRSAAIVRAPTGEPPRIWSADGPPCTHAFTEMTHLWHAPRKGAASA